MRKNFRPKLRSIKDAKHRILTDLKDMLRRWREHAEIFYYHEGNLTDDDGDQSPVRGLLESEAEKAIRKLPRSKAGRIDDLPAELLKTDK